MKLTNKITVLFGVALLALTGAAPSYAGLITFNYTGTINSGNTGLFSATDVMEGSFTFDMAATDSDGAGDKGEYVAISNSITIKNAGGTILYTSLEGTTPLVIKVENKGNDKYKLEDDDQTGRNGFGGETFDKFKLDLKDSTGGIFSDDSLPLSLDLSMFDSDFRKWELKFTGGGSTDTKGVLTSLSVAAVPIPAAVWLMGSALLGLVSIGRRKKPE